MKTTNQITEITGTIHTVYYSSPDWSSGKLKTANGLIAFAGNIYATVGNEVTLVGYYTKTKFGLQFKVKSVKIKMPINKEGIANWLEKNKEFKGIGKTKAKLLAEHFGVNFPKVLINKPEEIAKVAKITLQQALVIKNIWEMNSKINEVMIALLAYELTHNQATKLVSKYGDNIINIVKEDPYILIGEIKEFGFKRIDEIALKTGILKDSPYRIRACLIYCLKKILSDGNVWEYKQTIINTANTLLELDNINSKKLIENELNFLINSKEVKQLDNRIALTKAYETEKYIANWILQAVTKSPNKPTNNITNSNIPVQLNKAQKQAVIQALQSDISVISGKAGTGKSYTIARIIELIKDDNSIFLLAPTGKAARRMSELCKDKVQASTIHSFLGYNGSTFSFNKDNKITNVDVIIIDEMSMVDIFLFKALLEAIPETTKLIIVGDHNQLPSINAGNILKDIMASKKIPKVILTECMRQAGYLKQSCNKILDGVIAESNKKDWIVISKRYSAEQLKSLIIELFNNRLEKLGYDILRDVQLLTPVHKSPIGTKELNKELQKIIQKKLYNREVKSKFCKGDKVIYNRNNYQLNVMNGTIGIIEGLLNDEVIIKFDNKRVFVPKENMKDVSLAYALTIHKTQGSEFKCVLMVIHKSHFFVHHKGLMYTGATRAREKLIILGDPHGLRTCLMKEDKTNRKTFLKEMLEKGVC